MLDCARRRAGLAGQLGSPGAELGEVDAGERGRIGHDVPERQCPLDVGDGLRQPEDGFCLARRFD